MRIPALALAALAGAAIPAAALASQGADDPAGHDRTTTVQTTTTTDTTTTTQLQPPSRPGPRTGRRAAAIRAAKARVGGSTVVIRVRRRSDSGYEVRLRDADTSFTVRLDRRLRVVRLRQEPLRQQATVTMPADDDGTLDQGRGDARGTAPSAGGTDDDGTADRGRGDRSGRASGRDDDHRDDSGHGGSGGHGSDD